MTQIHETNGTDHQSATTEKKAGGRRGTAVARGMVHRVEEAMLSSVARAKTMEVIENDILNGATVGKFVLFGISRAERVKEGPIMRGLIEVNPAGQTVPVKVQVAAWLKIGRCSGTEYLSLKVGNNNPEDHESPTVGPFYGRLFRQVEGNRTRYFGFIEESEKTGEDENGQGTYVTHWQLRVTAKAALSNDQKTHYISGSVQPSQTAQTSEEESSNLPF